MDVAQLINVAAKWRILDDLYSLLFSKEPMTNDATETLLGLAAILKKLIAPVIASLAAIIPLVFFWLRSIAYRNRKIILSSNETVMSTA